MLISVERSLRFGQPASIVKLKPCLVTPKFVDLLL